MEKEHEEAVTARLTLLPQKVVQQVKMEFLSLYKMEIFKCYSEEDIVK